MFRRMLAGGLAAALVSAAPASAAQYNLVTMNELIQILQNAGLSASGTSNSEVLAVGQSFIWLTDCRPDGKCAEINFFRNYGDVRPTLAAVNEWNNTKKIPEASVNTDGTLHMEVWISAIGCTDTNIIDMFGWFERYVADTDFWGPYIRQS
ncbi:MAG: hypothetical protein ABL957_00020 [Parvularculaceae bacterium]